jgi:hypothetical protein
MFCDVIREKCQVTKHQPLNVGFLNSRNTYVLPHNKFGFEVSEYLTSVYFFSTYRVIYLFSSACWIIRRWIMLLSVHYCLYVLHVWHLKLRQRFFCKQMTVDCFKTKRIISECYVSFFLRKVYAGNSTLISKYFFPEFECLYAYNVDTHILRLTERLRFLSILG